MVRAKSLVLSILVLSASLADRAAAEAPSPPVKTSKAAEAEGRLHFQRGQKATNAGDYATAYREFEAGYAVTGRPLFLFNMAEAARAMGEIDKARTSYREFLRVDPDNALAATAKTRLSEIEPAPAAPPPQAPPILLPPSSVAPAPSSVHSAGQPLPPAPPAHDDAPLYKKWPFWAVVGVVVVGGGVTAYAVTRTSRTTDTCGAGCVPITFK